jgi:hypothetical protein
MTKKVANRDLMYISGLGITAATFAAWSAGSLRRVFQGNRLNSGGSFRRG